MILKKKKIEYFFYSAQTRYNILPNLFIQPGPQIFASSDNS